MSILLTGVAGFIGMHVARSLLDRGEQVVGVDSVNDYYDPTLKRDRLATMSGIAGFEFHECDVADRATLFDLVDSNADLDRVVHLAAQPGVRHSIERPFDYLQANLAGQLVMLEVCRRLQERHGGCRGLVYASSSSVYGASPVMPCSPGQRTDHPVSLYGATKKSCEVMAQSYAHLYRIPTIGLRFFTVYGPWGRPDMSPWIFTSRILAGEPIRLFNHGRMKRDFTHIADIVRGVVSALDRPPRHGEADAPHRIYNLGNDRPVSLTDYVRVIEQACGHAAIIEGHPLQPGDVLETWADISLSTAELGFVPSIPIETGVPEFVDWYRGYRGL
ncbi:MAG: NAD-dependent epimerase/dehydratase family protein [Alphaproteobacteria bacterium]|nr:NAD-dependent epimerase/dehydratase family protein [Alphaproteobacteria bacterium]